ncbi:MAG: acyl-CoA thioesterase [Pseudomonadota bacterium]|nr:acyl-CoA thioesterase [Pseudomonadota bacterium]
MHTTRFTIEFGDCDPAGIVFYPNYFRWMDSACLHFFRAAGVANWHQREAADGVLGIPLVDAQARFVAPATYGDEIEVDTSIEEWRHKSFVVRHRIRRGDVLLVEGREVRVFARKHPDHPERIQAVPPPADVRALCIPQIAEPSS